VPIHDRCDGIRRREGLVEPVAAGSKLKSTRGSDGGRTSNGHCLLPAPPNPPARRKAFVKPLRWTRSIIPSQESGSVGRRRGRSCPGPGQAPTPTGGRAFGGRGPGRDLGPEGVQGGSHRSTPRGPGVQHVPRDDWPHRNSPSGRTTGRFTHRVRVRQRSCVEVASCVSGRARCDHAAVVKPRAQKPVRPARTAECRRPHGVGAIRLQASTRCPFRLSPFDTLDPLAEKLINVPPRALRRPLSNEVRVRVGVLVRTG